MSITPPDSAARLAAIVASSDDAIVSKDLNGIIQTWNRGAERMFGYTAEEAVGQSITDVDPGGAAAARKPRCSSRIRAGLSVEHFETVRRRKDGSLVDISLTVSPVRTAGGEIIGASKIARDITEQRRLRADAEEASRHEGRVPRGALARAAHAAQYGPRLRAHAAARRRADDGSSSASGRSTRSSGTPTR